MESNAQKNGLHILSCRKDLLCAAILTLTLINSGCRDGSGLHPIAGIVIVDGAPLEGAVVTCQPQGAGQPAMATTLTGGKFKVASPGGKGVYPGTYKVSVSKVTGRVKEQPPPWVGKREKATPAEVAAWKQLQAENKKKEQELVPPPYNSLATTPLNITVPLGKDLVIDIKSAADAAKP